jgi:hypothetical protein
VADGLPDMEWDGSEWVPLHVVAQRHDHKGHSEEMCIRCGWIMGQIPLNCQNNDTPHVFPSQQAEIERLRAVLDVVDAQVAAYMNGSIGSSRAIQTISLLLDAEEARRG